MEAEKAESGRGRRRERIRQHKRNTIHQRTSNGMIAKEYEYV